MLHFLNIGLESGSEKIRAKILKRQHSNESISKAVHAAKKYGILIGLQLLIGVPGETKKDFQETLDLLNELKPDWIYPNIYQPYPGTALYKKAVKLGILKGKNPGEFKRSMSTYSLPGFSSAEIQKGRKKAWLAAQLFDIEKAWKDWCHGRNYGPYEKGLV